MPGDRLARLRDLRKKALEGGGPDAVPAYRPVSLALPLPQRPQWCVIYAADNGHLATIGTMTATMTPQALAKRIAQVAVLRGEFTLRSGRKSDYYIDKYLLTTQPDILAELGKMLAEHVPSRTTRLAGAELEDRWRCRPR